MRNTLAFLGSRGDRASKPDDIALGIVRAIKDPACPSIGQRGRSGRLLDPVTLPGAQTRELDPDQLPEQSIPLPGVAARVGKPQIVLRVSAAPTDRDHVLGDPPYRESSQPAMTSPPHR
jgi:hypothetical protein